MDPSAYLEPRYTFRQAAAAADFPVNTLRSNFQRGWFRSFGNGLHPGQGRTQRLCLGDILVLAIAGRLIDLGISPSNAYNAAYAFGAVTRNQPGQPRRQPFQSFDRSKYETLLLWRRGSPEVVPLSRDDPVTRLGLDGLEDRAAVVISLGAVEATMFSRLGLPLPDQGND